MKLKTRKILVLQHAEPEHLGRIADVLNQEKIDYTYFRPDLGDLLPANLDDYHGMVAMGGPQSVYEEQLFPYLKSEKALIREAITTNRPVLGVCLGSQLLAEVLGSNVYPGRMFELGWRSVVISKDAFNDPVFEHLPNVITPLHWHGDVYDLPSGAISIGSSTITPVQGFSLKQRFYGLLFHLETTLEQLTAMVDTFPSDVHRGGTTSNSLVSEAPECIAAISEPSCELFRRWTKLI